MKAGAAFLLAQLGAHAAQQFAQRLAKLNLSPPHAGILRLLNASAGTTQQALAQTLGMVPSRLVVLIDELEARGLVERLEYPDDRRRHALYLTEKGRSMLETIGAISREHSRSLLAALSVAEQRTLADLLQRVADEQKLVRGVHPGYARVKAQHANDKESDAQ